MTPGITSNFELRGFTPIGEVVEQLIVTTVEAEVLWEASDLGQAEVDEASVSIGVEHDIVRLDITVYDSKLVESGKSDDLSCPSVMQHSSRRQYWTNTLLADLPDMIPVISARSLE